jgi:hypothetical protein
MVNFRVADLDAMLAQLRPAGVEVIDALEESELGRSGWACRRARSFTARSWKISVVQSPPCRRTSCARAAPGRTGCPTSNTASW